MTGRTRGFTLIGLLVVIAIIAILMAIIMPALHTAKKIATSAVCLGNPASWTFYDPLASYHNKSSMFGFADVLVASAYGQGLYWYAWPNWTKHRIAGGSFTTDMQAGNVDKDGGLDVIILLGGTGLVWFENPRPQGNPATTVWRMHRIDQEGGRDLEAGDVDGDGRLDVVVRRGRTRVFLQDSPVSWCKIGIPTGGRGETALGDLDNDGDLDIAQDGYRLETPADKSSEWQRHEIAPGWPDDGGVHIADINHDGRMDGLLAPAETTGRLVWYEAADPKNGPWKEHVIDTDVAYIHTFKTADVNRDGELDVITAEMEQSAQRRVSIYFNEGQALRWRPQVVGWTGSHNLRIADIGNDGDLDIIGANHGNYGGHTPVDLWENLTNRPAPALSLDRWQRHVIDPERPWGAAFIRAGDRDGDCDVVVGEHNYEDPASAKLHVFENADGRGERWKDHVVSIGDEHHDGAILADMDNDGDLDIISIGWRHSRVLLYANLAIAPGAGPGSAGEPLNFILFDLDVTHRGDHQWYSNWDFQTHRKTNPQAPANWRAGENSLFDGGIYHWRVEVVRMERAWEWPMPIQFGWWNISDDPVIRHIASPGLLLTHLEPPAPGQPWIYVLVGAVRTLDATHMYYGKGRNQDKHITDWDWSRAFAPDTAYTLVNPLKNDLDENGDGRTSEMEYPDLEIHTVLTLHRPGSPAYESLCTQLPR